MHGTKIHLALRLGERFAASSSSIARCASTLASCGLPCFRMLPSSRLVAFSPMIKRSVGESG
jgi:hypothetical protein